MWSASVNESVRDIDDVIGPSARRRVLAGMNNGSVPLSHRKRSI
jgi:hypothetical protein